MKKKIIIKQTKKFQANYKQPHKNNTGNGSVKYRFFHFGKKPTEKFVKCKFSKLIIFPFFSLSIFAQKWKDFNFQTFHSNPFALRKFSRTEKPNLTDPSLY